MLLRQERTLGSLLGGGGGGKKNHVLLRYHRGSVGCLR